MSFFYTIKAFAFLLLCTASLLAFSAPSINGISGEFKDGASLTISGLGFGNSGQAIPVLWDSVDNQDYLSGLPDKSEVPEGGGYTFDINGSAWASKVLVDKSKGRGIRESSYRGGSQKSYFKWSNELGSKNLRNVYISWWFWAGADPAGSGGSNKFIRVWDDHDGEHTRISWTQMHMTYVAKDLNPENKVSWNSWKGDVGQWNRFELWVSADSKIIKAWTNHKLVHNVNDFIKSPSSKGFDLDVFGFDPNVADDYAGFRFNFGDIYISGSQARVEVSDTPTWSESGSHREIQIPVSWSDNKINVNLNLGALSNVNNLYLYVIDEKGNVNQDGYPLSLNVSRPKSMVMAE